MADVKKPAYAAGKTRAIGEFSTWYSFPRAIVYYFLVCGEHRGDDVIGSFSELRCRAVADGESYVGHLNWLLRAYHLEKPPGKAMAQLNEIRGRLALITGASGG